ncbi:hypothetical protein EW145_g5469 [Phellinidium pouzarii]|uniref:Protein kinase domain-containing protein n=1 Tax=Phellinidium pouzarii TaxID=167371 RepID=A0A4V3XC54_9AGAM|nr:hypothetical protein EW145_g5469 [Phellinidium pouzarii]
MGNGDERVRVPARIDNWILEYNLGSGYSGSIWRAHNPFTNQIAAIKVQDVDHECPTNRYERNFYPSLQGGLGMPTLWASGVHGEYDYLVIDLLGPSLDNLYRKNGKSMDLRSTICIAMQVISRLEFMHSRGILHRDIQLGNCVIGRGKNERLIYMIDFGFSKRYIDPHTRKHIPDSRVKRDFIGNYWFSSVNVHCRVPSRRDDMEALALMLIHVMIDDGLPWTRNGIPKNNKQQDVIIRQKLGTSPDELCRGLPPVFEEFLRYCRRLRFFDRPNYRQWKERFADLAREKGYVESDGGVNDELAWPPKPEEMLISPKRRARTAKRSPSQKAGGEVAIEDILAEIAKMRLDNNRIPTKEKPIADTSRSYTLEKDKASKSKSGAARGTEGSDKSKQLAQTNIIVISSDDESEPSSRQLGRTIKQAAMRQLTRKARRAYENAELAQLVREFVKTMQANRSKFFTKEAFDFLSALGKQLENPSVFVLPDSQAPAGDRNLAATNGSQKRLRQRPLPTPKVETVKDLRLRLQNAPFVLENAQLAKMIADFSAAIRASSGKTINNDGFVFLDSVAARLEGS